MTLAYVSLSWYERGNCVQVSVDQDSDASAARRGRWRDVPYARFFTPLAEPVSRPLLTLSTDFVENISTLYDQLTQLSPGAPPGGSRVVRLARLPAEV